MAKLSIVIPSRNEQYLKPTIDSIFANARGEVEVVAVIEDSKSKMPEGWSGFQQKHPNLHTILHPQAKGMRPSINAGVASAISRRAKYIAKFDAHCAFGEGFDELLKAECDEDWIVVPRRKRLDPETFAPRDDGRPDIDYHYLSFPDDPNDFGGPGLNGKVWDARSRERKDVLLDDEMSSQGSGWFMHAAYFTHLELMDEHNYGKFWNEFQELGLKCWLSGGQVKVNKRTWYAHWHKGKAGRGYRMPEAWLQQGATFTKNWIWNNAQFNHKQTRPFSWLIEHFWPVPTWPADWQEKLYAEKPPLLVGARSGSTLVVSRPAVQPAGLVIHAAHYGPTGTELDVTKTLQSKVTNNSLDMMVTNDDLQVGNPFRGQKKLLAVTYSYNGDKQIAITKTERDWLVIGEQSKFKPVAVGSETPLPPDTVADPPATGGVAGDRPSATVASLSMMSDQVESPKVIENMLPQALIDFLVRRFQIPTYRLRGPMPIEVPQFHRNDLAALFAELQFNRGAEIGVAEGNYSEVLVKANPDLQLLCVDPWHAYSGNTQQKSKEKHEYAYNEAKRKLQGSHAQMIMKTSMEAVLQVPDESLDFIYIDGNHSFNYVMLDLICWSAKVRKGGIIAGDDFYHLDRKRWGAGPVEAVTSYTQAHAIEPWFIFNAHKSVDFMWIKQ